MADPALYTRSAMYDTMVLTSRIGGLWAVVERPVCDRRSCPGRVGCARYYKVHQLLALEESAPHVVTLTGRNHDFHLAAGGLVALGEQSGVGIQRHDVVLITVDVKDRHVRLGQRGDPIRWVELGQVGLQLLGGQAIRTARPRKTGIASEVADGVDPGDAFHLLRVFHGPTVEHQATSAAREQASLLGKAALFGEKFVQCVVGRPSLRATERLAHIDPRDRDARL